MNNFSFKVEEDIKKLGLKGSYFLMTDMRNSQSDDIFESLLQDVISQKLNELSPSWIESNNILLGFRKLHTKVNRSNRKFVASPENLYNFLCANRKLPRINLIVDIYNLISVKYGLALGSHDLSKISGNIILKMTTGDEKFIPLGQTESKPIQKGDYAYVDDSNDIICHLEVRQVEKTKISLSTTDAFYIVQGNENTTDEYIEMATRELVGLIKRFCGGEEKRLLTF